MRAGTPHSGKNREKLGMRVEWLALSDLAKWLKVRGPGKSRSLGVTSQASSRSGENCHRDSRLAGRIWRSTEVVLM